MDLLDGDWVKVALDDAEDGAEAPWCVDDVQLAQTLWVVVLRDGGGHLDVAVDGWRLGDADALEVHDCAEGLDQVAGLARAGWETWVAGLFVLDGEVLEHALLAGDLVHGWEIDVAELLDVDWAAILVCRLVSDEALFRVTG